MTRHAWVEDERSEQEILRDVNADLAGDHDPFASAVGICNGLVVSLVLWAALAVIAWCL